MFINRTKLRDFRNTPAMTEARRLFESGDRIGAARILAKYDVVDPNKNIAQHRKSSVETQPEDRILRSYDRARLINLTRDAERNASNARGMLLQLRLNVASGIKAKINTDDDSFNRSASFWFNSVFAHSCSWTDDDTLEDIAENIIAARFREGDCLAVFDPIGDDSPKLKIYEADQFVSLSKEDLRSRAASYPWITADAFCEQGVICDGYGRVLGYAVSSAHGVMASDHSSVSLFRRGEQARLLRKKFRFDQLRGVPDMSASIMDILDIYDMRSKEIQTAKLAGTLALVSESQSEQDAIADLAESRDFGDIFADDSSSSTVPEPVSHDTIPDDDDWHEMRELTGAMIKRNAPGEKVSALDIDRPNLNAESFYESVTGTAGAGIGLMKCYARGEVSTSYTAFRGEMVMTWRQFEACQKWLERQFLDWTAVHALEWAVRHGSVPMPSDPMWRFKISWTFPKMPAVDPEKESRARISDISAGFTDYAAECGPDWNKIFTSLGVQKKAAEAAGIALAPFRTMPGEQTQEPPPDADLEN